MDRAGVNGSGATNQNEAKEKVNKALLLKQQIEENRKRMLNREKEMNDSKRNLEQMFTQLDRSASNVSLNMSIDVEDTRDTKIASLESTVSNLKSEKTKLELRVLSLETIQEAKECLEIEIGELRLNRDQILAENSILHEKVQRLHELEDENDELKSKLDRLSYDNSSLKQDLEGRDKRINALELKLVKMRQEVEESSVKSSALISASQEEFQKQLNDLSNERQKLQQECESLQLKLSELETKPIAPPPAEVKVASLGAKKKQRTKKEKNAEPLDGEKKDTDLLAQVEALTAQKVALEFENGNLKSAAQELEEKLAESIAEGQTLQQRVQLLMTELETEAAPSKDLANLQTILSGKEKEVADLSNELLKVQSEKAEIGQKLEEADNELFKLRAKCKDSDYLLGTKEELIKELESRLEAPVREEVPVQNVKVSTLGAKKKPSQRRGKGGRLQDGEASNQTQQQEKQSTEASAVKLNEEIASLKQKLEDSEAEKQTLNQRVQLLMAEIQSSEVNESNVKVDQQAEIDELNEELNELKQKLSDTEEERRQLHQRVKFLIVELEASQLPTYETCESNDKRTEHLASVEERLVQLENEKQALQQRVELLLNELQSFDNQGDELSELKAVLESKEAELATLTTKSSESEVKLFKLRAEMRDLVYATQIKDEKINELQLQLDEAAREPDEKSGTVANLQEALYQAREELSKADVELNGQSQAMKQLEKSCTTLNREAGDLKQEIAKLKEDLAEAEVVLAEKDTKLKIVQDELNRFKVKADEENELFAIEEERNHLQMENEIIRNDLATRSSQLDECKQCAERLERQLEEANSKVAELSSSLEAANSQKATADEKFNQLTDKYKRLAANYKQKLQVIQQLEAKLEKMTDGAGDDTDARLKLVDLEAEVEALKTQLEKTKEEKQSTNEKIVELEEQNQRLRDEKMVMEQSPDDLEPLKLAMQRAEEELASSQSQLQSTQEELQLVLGESRKLLEQLDSSNGRVTQLEEQLAIQQELDDHLKLKEHQISELEKQLREALNSKTMFQEQVEQLNSQLDSGNDAYSELQRQLNELWQEKQQLSNSNVYLEQELERYRSQLNDFSSKHQTEVDREREELVSRLGNMEHEIQHLRNEFSSVQWQLDEKKSEIVELLERKEVDERQVADFKLQLEQLSPRAESLKAELIDLREKNAQLEHNWTDLNNQYGNLYSSYGAMEHEKTVLENQLIDAKLRVDQLNEELGRLKAVNEEMAEKSGNLEREAQTADSLRQQLTDLGLINSQMSSELFELRRRLEESDSTFQDAMEKDRLLEQLKHELETVKKSLNEAENSLVMKGDEIAALRDVISGKDAFLEQNKLALEQIQREKQELDQQLWNKTEELSIVQDSVAGKEQFLEQLKQELESLRKSLVEAENNLLTKEDEMTVLRDALSGKDVLLEQIQREKQELDQQLWRKDEEMGSVQESMAEKDRVLEQVNIELGQKSIQLDAFRETFQTERHDLEQRIVLLQQEIDERSSNSKEDELAMQVQQLELEKRSLAESLEEQKKMAADVQEIGQLRIKLADLTDERDDLSYQLEDVQSQCSSFEEKIALYEARIAELQTEKTEKESSVMNQLEQLTLERDELSSRLADIEKLNEELSALKTDLEISRQLNNQLEERALGLERQLSDAVRCLGEEEKKRRDLQDERDDLSSKSFELSIQLGELEALKLEKTSLKQKLDEQQQEMERYESMAELYEQYKADAESAGRWRQEVENLKKQAEEVADLRMKLFDAVAEKEELESTIQSLEEDVSNANQQLERMKLQAVNSDELKRLNEEIAHLRAKLFEAVTSKDELESSVQTLEEELELARDEIVSAKKKLDAERDVSAELEAAQQEIASLKVDLEASQSVLEQVDALRDELATVKSRNAQLTHDKSMEDAVLEAERASNVELSAKCADLDMERNLLMEKCMELRDHQSAIEAKLEELRVENEKLKSAPVKHESNEELAQLRMALMELTTERDEAEEKLIEAEEKLGELTNLSIANSELSMELDEARERLGVLEREYRDRASELERRLAESTLRLTAFEERVDRVSLERDQLQQTVQRLEEQAPVQVEKAQTQEKPESDDLNKRIASLESELHETKVKAAKSLRQVKVLKAELAKVKEESKGGDDFFTQVVEDELRKQVAEAERVTAEKVKEIQRLLLRIDTLEGANERFLAAKERQDNEVAMLEQRIRELQSKISTLEWDQPEVKEVEHVAKQQAIVESSPGTSQLEATISQLTDDNEHYQDLLDELKAERQAVEEQLKEKMAALELDLAEKTRLLDEISRQVDNKDKLLADAYDSVSQLRKQVMQLSEGGASVQLEEMRRENENLVDMIRQLATTGTLDEATVRRLKEEISQTTGVELEQLHQSTDSGESHIDWHGAFNDLQIEVEYLRSQNAALLNRLQEAGLVWEDGKEPHPEGNDRLESLRIQLDNAVREVHERDVRCQELTWEITKLLEERDTLQLRLSNALRQNHEMQQELKDYIATASGASPIGDIAIKLRELKQLNYALDVQLRREQEERQTIERQLMALYGSRGGSSSPGYVNGSQTAKRTAVHQQASDADPSDVDNYQDPATGQVLSEWLKGKESNVQHV